MKAKIYQVAGIAVVATLANCASASNELASCDPGEITTKTFRFTSAAMPLNNFHAVIIGHDFDGDAKPNNLLGAATSGLAVLAPDYNPGAVMAKRLQSSPWTLSLSQCTESNAAQATLEHDGIREVAAAIRKGDQFKISGQELSVPATWLSDSVGGELAPGWMKTHQAELVINVQQGTVVGKFAALVDPNEVRRQIVAPLTTFLNQPQRSGFLRFSIDADHNGLITSSELNSNRAFLDLTAADSKEGEAADGSWASVAFDIEASLVR